MPGSVAPSSSSWPVSKWLPGLEHLRGLAALMVVFHHSAQQCFGLWSGPSWEISEWLGGWGVTLFFVLSGFCIHLPHARQLVSDPGARVDWPLFARRRIRRLVPTYLAALLLSAVAGVWAQEGGLLSAPTPRALVEHALFLHSWTSENYSINAVFWSIAIEVHFYAAYPLFLWMRRRTGPGLLSALLAVGGIGLYALASRYVDDGSLRRTLQQCFLASWWKWALGAWMADLYVRARRSRATPLLTFPGAHWVWGVGSLALAYLPLRVGGLAVRGPLLPLVCALWVAALVVRPPRVRDPYWFLGKLGLVSYSLYLVHPLALALLRPLNGSLPAPLLYALNIVLSLPVAWLFFVLVERRFLQQRAPAPAASAAPA